MCPHSPSIFGKDCACGCGVHMIDNDQNQVPNHVFPPIMLMPASEHCREESTNSIFGMWVRILRLQVTSFVGQVGRQTRLSSVLIQSGFLRCFFGAQDFASSVASLVCSKGLCSTISGKICFIGCIVQGLAETHVADTIPWADPRTSIIIRALRPFARITMDLSVEFPGGCDQNSHECLQLIMSQNPTFFSGLDLANEASSSYSACRRG